MDAADHLERGREAFARRAWNDAHAALSAADLQDPADLERLATAAYMLAREDEYVELQERAHRAHLEAGDVERAARCAFWLSLHLKLRGEAGRASGWRARGQRLLRRSSSASTTRTGCSARSAPRRPHAGRAPWRPSPARSHQPGQRLRAGRGSSQPTGVAARDVDVEARALDRRDDRPSHVLGRRHAGRRRVDSQVDRSRRLEPGGERLGARRDVETGRVRALLDKLHADRVALEELRRAVAENRLAPLQVERPLSVSPTSAA